MKKNILLVILIAATAFACDNGDDEQVNINAPTITLEINKAEDEEEYYAGRIFELKVEADFPGKFANLSLSITKEGGSEYDINEEFNYQSGEEAALEISADSTQLVLNYQWETLRENEGNWEIKITATDIEGNEANEAESLLLTIAPATLVEYNNISLGTQSTTIPSCLNLLDGETYMLNEVADNHENIDLVFFWTNHRGSFLSSTNDLQLRMTITSVNFASLYNTRMIRMDDDFYDQVQDGNDLMTEIEKYSNSEFNIRLETVQSSWSGRSYLFKMDADRGGHVGVFKIEEFNRLDNSWDIEVKFSIRLFIREE